MKPIKSDVVEGICPACNGTGFLPVITKPAPGKRIYPPRCTKCGGKGKVPKSGIHTLHLISVGTKAN
jgi:DnaJ-class molecular chaperone